MLKLLFPLLFISFSTSAMSQTPEQYIEDARKGLTQQTSSHRATWHLGNEEQWSADLNAGLIVFGFADGMRAVAPIQVIGTYNQVDGTFLWGWDHPSVPEPLRKHALLAKQWGEQNQIKAYTTRNVSCTEDDVWYFSAVANRLANSNGVYRGTSGSTLVFMTFGEITFQKVKQ